MIFAILISTLALPVVIFTVSIIFLIIRIFGIHCYIVQSKDDVINIRKKITFSSYIFDNEPSGLFIGNGFCGNIYESGDSQSKIITIYLICSKIKYGLMTKSNSGCDTISGKKQKIAHLCGSSWCLSFKQDTYIYENLKLSDEQTAIVNESCDYFKDNTHCVLYISGEPGTGKTTVVEEIAYKLNATLVEDLGIWQPNLTMAQAIDMIGGATEESPIVICINEFDSLILDPIFNGTVPEARYMRTEISSKSAWNGLLDNIAKGRHKWVFLALTSNATRKTLNNKYNDSSLLRDGRINLYKELNKHVFV